MPTIRETQQAVINLETNPTFSSARVVTSWPFVSTQPYIPEYLWINNPTTADLLANPHVPKKKEHVFKVGDRVLLPQSSYSTKGEFTGVVKSIDNVRWITVIYEEEFFKKYAIPGPTYQTIAEKLIPLPKGYKKLSPVEKKCKKLWNESNWVKKNPHLAY